MSKALRVPDFLEHISEAIERILVYVQGLDERQFLANQLIQDAAMRNLEIVGEAARNIMRVDPGFARRHPNFPLGQAIGMRNTLTHVYFGVKLDQVWKTITQDIPLLQTNVA
jgi:uncharacterized protein with HEPN domain